MSVQLNLGEYQIQPKTFRFERKKMVDILRDESLARRVFPVGPSIPVWQKETQYFEVSEDDNTQYNLDLVAPKYSRFAAIEKRPRIPVHQGDLGYDRHRVAALRSDILKLDERQKKTVKQINQDEHRVAFAGDVRTGITSFADTTNNATAWTGELDLTSFATGIATFNAGLSQYQRLLKNEWDGGTTMIVWTWDVDARAKACLNTDQTKTFYQWLKGEIGEANIIATDYLGSEAGSGTTNAVLIRKKPSILELMSSNLEVVSGLSALKDLKVQIALRSRPIFYQKTSSVLYSATVDITA